MITQKIRIPVNYTSTVIFGNEAIFPGLELYELTPLPAWFIAGGFDPWITVCLITPPTTGTYTYYFDSGGSPYNQDACLIMEVVDSFVTSLTTCNSDDAINIHWVTREGGRASYIFNQRKDYGINIGESKTFDNNGSIKYISRGKYFDNRVVYKSGLTNTEVDLIESLRCCIQAWEWNPDTDVSTPVLFNSESFPKYNTKNKFNEVSLRYRIATYKEVQNQ